MGSTISGVARNVLRGFQSIEIARARKIFRPHAPLIVTTHAMALDLAAKTGFYRL